MDNTKLLFLWIASTLACLGKALPVFFIALIEVLVYFQCIEGRDVASEVVPNGNAEHVYGTKNRIPLIRRFFLRYRYGLIPIEGVGVGV